MSTMESQITGVSIDCSTVGSGVDQRKHKSSVSLAFERGIQRWPVNSPHKRPVPVWLRHRELDMIVRGFQFQVFGGLIYDVRIFKERKFNYMFNDIVFLQ